MGRGRGTEGEGLISRLRELETLPARLPSLAAHTEGSAGRLRGCLPCPALPSPPHGGTGHKLRGERGDGWLHSQPLLPTWTIGTVLIELTISRLGTEG